MGTRGQDENKVLTARGCHTSPESQGHLQIDWSLQNCLKLTEMHLAQMRHTLMCPSTLYIVCPCASNSSITAAIISTRTYHANMITHTA